MSDTHDVIIVGGGVIGAAIAFNLAQHGIEEKNFLFLTLTRLDLGPEMIDSTNQ